ncbi:MAG: response regulator [Spirochaetaceae bacterium]
MKVRYKISVFLSIFFIIVLISLLAIWFNILTQTEDNFNHNFRSEVLEFGIELSDLYAQIFFEEIDDIRSIKGDISTFEILSTLEADGKSQFIIDFHGKVLEGSSVPSQMLDLLSSEQLEAAMDHYRISNELEFSIDNYTQFTETDELILPVRIHYRIEPKEMIILAYGQALYSVFARIHAQNTRNIELGETYIKKGIGASLLILLISIVGVVLFSLRLITQPVEAIIKGIVEIKDDGISIRTGDEFQTIGETINELNEQSLNLIRKVQDRERQFKLIFQNAEISIWNEDLSGVKLYLDKLREKGVDDLKTFLTDNQDILMEIIKLVNVNQINDATLKLFDASSKELFIQDISKTFGPDANNIFIDELCSIWNEEDVFRSEAVFHTINGKKIFAIISLRIPETLEDFKNIPVCIIDITDRKQAEIALKTSQASLNHTRKMEAIGQLAGGIAHDFNNILGAIINSSFLLKSPKRNLDDRGLKYVDMIMQASSRASDLIKKLLTFSRKGNLTYDAIDINEIVDDAEVILSSTLDKNIKIIVTKYAINSIIIGDNSSINNMLLNLCINASHAMPNGGEIQISTRNKKLSHKYCEMSSFDITPGNYCELEVMDNGLGISQENLHKIFDPFFTTKEQGKGTGLGLSTVYGAVKEHHGAVTVYSEISVGTTFHLLLPCSSEHVKVLPKRTNSRMGSGMILLVDDEELIRFTGKAILEELGYTVMLAENGQKAFDLFKINHLEIDLILMDMIMPVMNGYEAFMAMREMNSGCKVVITSGYTNNEKLNAMKVQGLNGFIRKPFKVDELSHVIAEILDH